MAKKKAIHWNERLGAVENVKASLPKLVKDYLSLGRKAAAGKANGRDLHKFRLATKRFRYTLEIFVPLYGAGLQARLKRVRSVQETLGELQDCQMALGVSALKKNSRLREWLDRQSAIRKAAFQRTWAREFGGLNVERDWVAYLQRYAREKTS